MPARLLWLDELKDEIISKYLDERLSTVRLGKHYRVHAGTIERRLRQWDVPIRRVGRKFVDHTAFDKITNNTCYWMGYLAGDGCIEDNRNGAYRIQLGSKDKEQIEKFRNFVQAEHPIQRFKSGIWYVKFTSERMANKLIEYGIVPRKSLILDIPNPNITHNTHFLRGIIDADGSICANKKYHSAIIKIYTGSKIFATQLLSVILDVSNISANIYCPQNGYAVTVSGKQRVKGLICDVYMTAPKHIRLDRKYIRAMKLLSGEYP